MRDELAGGQSHVANAVLADRLVMLLFGDSLAVLLLATPARLLAFVGVTRIFVEMETLIKVGKGPAVAVGGEPSGSPPGLTKATGQRTRTLREFGLGRLGTMPRGVQPAEEARR